MWGVCANSTRRHVERGVPRRCLLHSSRGGAAAPVVPTRAGRPAWCVPIPEVGGGLAGRVRG